MAITTYRDLLEACLQDLQIVGAGDAMTGDDGSLALDRLNDWIDGLALEGLTIPSISRVTWTLTANVSSYTVGSGSTVNISKPVSPQAIANIGYRDTSATTPQEVLFGGVMTEQQYQAVPQKTLTSTLPTGFYYSAGSGTTGTLSPLPIPTSTTLQGVIYAPALLAQVALSDTIALPAGYRRFLRSNLTVELGAAFEKPAPAEITRIATHTRRMVKTANLRLVDLSLDRAVLVPRSASGYDINTDQS